MIDFSKLKGLSIPEGAVKQIADAAGNVLWSAFIKFAMNGETYIADRGMTWAEWFASSYNTTGETEGDIKDANGNEVSMDAVIIGGTAYEVGFGPKALTIEVRGDGGPDAEGYDGFAEASVGYNGVEYYAPTTFEATAGDVIILYGDASDGCEFYVNNHKVGAWDYKYTVTTDAIIHLKAREFEGGDWKAYINVTEIPAGCFAFTCAIAMDNDSGIRASQNGMTWEEWCNSEYNSPTNFYRRYFVNGEYVQPYQGSIVAFTLNGVFVKPTDVIVANATYLTKRAY